MVPSLTKDYVATPSFREAKSLQMIASITAQVFNILGFFVPAIVQSKI